MKQSKHESERKTKPGKLSKSNLHAETEPDSVRDKVDDEEQPQEPKKK